MSFCVNIPVGVVFLSLALSACGGSGSSSNSADALVPPPTNSSLTDLQYTETFEAAAASFKGSIGALGITGVSSEASDLGSDVTITYNASNDSYSVSIDQAGINASTTFSPTDIDGASSDDEITVYERDSGNVSQLFVLFNPDAPSFPLSYVTYGGWLEIDSGSNTIEATYMTFGVRTASDDVPSSGMASYTGVTEGYWNDGSNLLVTSGDVDLTANFTSNSIMGTIDLIGQDVVTNAIRPYDQITASGTISGNRFSGNLAAPVRGASGTWQGGFFGPGAAELGASYRLTGGAQHVTGVIVGKKD
jgi:hypothetical protein